jgi:hypothetical protein
LRDGAAGNDICEAAPWSVFKVDLDQAAAQTPALNLIRIYAVLQRRSFRRPLPHCRQPMNTMVTDWPDGCMDAAARALPAGYPLLTVPENLFAKFDEQREEWLEKFAGSRTRPNQSRDMTMILVSVATAPSPITSRTTSVSVTLAPSAQYLFGRIVTNRPQNVIKVAKIITVW